MRSSVRVPPPRVHPFVVAKVAQGDRSFTRNFLSAHTRVSSKALLFIGAVFLAFILLVLLL